MHLVSKLLASAVFAAGLALAAAPAHAVTFAISTGPFSLPGNASGVIPSNVIVSGSNTYDFTFTTVGGTYKTLMQMQSSRLSTGQPVPLSFTLFKGPVGGGVFVANSGGTPTAATLISLTSGSYYMELVESHAPKELVTGGITLLSAVPEPASWAMMLVGVGGLGAVMRRRRQTVSALA
jgi:hypothetical protein